VIDSKRVIYDGFRQALLCGVPSDLAGILVDEEFGADILLDASRNGYVTALSTEKSGSDEFEFEYGDAFAQHIEMFQPTIASVVRGDPEAILFVEFGEEEEGENLRRLFQLSELSQQLSLPGCRECGSSPPCAPTSSPASPEFPSSARICRGCSSSSAR